MNKHHLKSVLVLGGNRKQYGSVLSSVILNREWENKSSDMCTNGNNCASLRNIVPFLDKTEFLKKKLAAGYPILLCSQIGTDVLIASFCLHVISGPGVRCSSNSDETVQCRVC